MFLLENLIYALTCLSKQTRHATRSTKRRPCFLAGRDLPFKLDATQDTFLHFITATRLLILTFSAILLAKYTMIHRIGIY